MISKGELVMASAIAATGYEKSMVVPVTRSRSDAKEEVDTGYSFGANGNCTIRVASDIEDRRKAWELVYNVYTEQGYAEPDDSGLWYGPYDILPEACTLLVERGDDPLATLTLTPDSPLGLSADQLYREEIDALRSKGRVPCEIISLASQEKNLRHGAEIVKHLFKLAYLTATRLMGATDFLITVNPRHVRFYERTLLMKKIGVEKEFRKVGGAPAVLLGLDLTTAQQLCLERYGDSEGSFYRFFINPKTEPALIAMVMRQRQILKAADIRCYFIEHRPIVQSLSPVACRHLETFYPNLFQPKKQNLCAARADIR